MTEGRAGSSYSERRRYIKLTGQVQAMSILGPGENSSGKKNGQVSHIGMLWERENALSGRESSLSSSAIHLAIPGTAVTEITLI